MNLVKSVSATALVDLLDTSSRSAFQASPILNPPPSFVEGPFVTDPTKKTVVIKPPMAGRRMGSGSVVRYRPEVVRTLGRARLGQLYGGSYAAQYSAAVSALNSTKDPYRAFVSFVLSEIPEGVGWGGSDAYQVNEALRSFERNYSLEQDAREAAAWGARFPIDMRGDMAFSRMRLDDPKYEDDYLGHYVPIGGYFNTAAPSAVSATKTLGDRWGTVEWVDDSFTYIKNLTGATSQIFYWYAHVYRALQTFIPAMAVYYQQKGIPPTQIFADFVVPNLESPAVFVAWVVAANTFMFERFGGAQALRNTLTDAQLSDAAEGYRLATDLTNAENYFYGLVAQQIKAEISFLSGIEFVLKVLALPVTAAVNAVELAKGFSWWQWGLIGFVAVGVGYVILKALP